MKHVFCMSLLSVTPLDVVKIRLQAQKNPFPKGMLVNFLHCIVCRNKNKISGDCTLLTDTDIYLF